MIRPALLSTGPAALNAAARQAECAPGFYIIVARGSNQPADEGTAGQVGDLIEAQVPSSYSVAIDYPAAIIRTTSIYPTSVAGGQNDFVKKIEDYVAACGADSKIALIGYAQRANVMTNVLAGGVAKPAPIDGKYQDNIKAVVVLGDPTFSKGQYFNEGTSTTSDMFSRRDDGDSLKLLNTHASVRKSYCDEGDPFCSSVNDVSVHSAPAPKYAQAAADFAASKA